MTIHAMPATHLAASLPSIPPRPAVALCDGDVSGQSHDGSFSDGRSVAGVNARPSPNRAVVDNGGADDLSVKDL